MEKIAITGNIACGKSCALRFIQALGYSIIDADDIVYDLYEEPIFIKEIEKIFPKIVSENKINKKILRDILFSDKSKKLEFEKHLYPTVLEKINNFFNENKSQNICFVIVPLLFEAGFEKYFDKIILITADDKIREERLIKRGSLLSGHAKNVMAAQISQEEKIPRCDYIIENNGTLEEFKNAVENLLKAL